MNEQKRVYTLYRVSTLGQVEKDDIPMQKQCCREFASQQGWKIVREFSEKGVSGYKVSAKDRDAIQTIQREAVQGKFDVLLVFMFDRLGRRDDETPFVVEWFAKQGIEVWSAMEGQQRFDTHVDKLMNYIRYWQASGESLKTSVRVKTRLGQLTEEGLYTGGAVPYGYHLVKNGRTNKRNREVCDLEIDEQEAQIVRLIFQKYVNEGYGAQRLCHYLYEQKYTGREGKGFPNTTINRIVKNEIYTGILKNGESQSGYLESLQIIDQETYDRAQQIMAARTTHHSEVPLNSKGKSLLVGNIFCGHCGNRLTLTTSGRKRIHTDGSVSREVRMRYQCHYKVRHPGDCDGQSGYGVKKLDELVDKVVRMKFAQIKSVSEEELISAQQDREIELAKTRCEQLDSIRKEKEADLADLKAETIKVIRGKSKLSEDLLNELIGEATAALESANADCEAARQKLDELQTTAKELTKEYHRLLTWADMYATCTFESKKMIVSQLINAVRVYRDYTLEIDFNISFEELK